MFKRILLIISLCLLTLNLEAKESAHLSIAGKIRNSESKKSVVGVSIIVDGSYLWAVSDKDGVFHIDNLESGEYSLTVEYLGYVTRSVAVTLTDKSISNLIIDLQESTLEIDEVVVTSQAAKDKVNTSYTVGRNALNHMQVSDISSVTALLPGGKTINPDLTTENTISIRGGSSSSGNASFGTAIEVDGVRMSSNGSFGELSGSSTRSVAVDNIESVEVITGVPSVEYGDINSGIVMVKTRRGYSPLNVTLTANPKTYQVSASQGISLNDNGSALNLSAEWARATSSLVSPYESYTRRGVSAIYSNTFAGNLKFEAGLTANIGGQNSEDDPDAYSGEYSTASDNVLRTNSSLEWLINRDWITNLKFDVSASLNDKTTHNHTYTSSASQQPSVHSTTEGYFIADQLDYTYFSDEYTESKEVNLSASVKYELNKKFGDLNSRFKAGLQWKATGNEGQGEYYEDMSYAPSGFRERDYSEYPYMHNLSLYAEERLTIPIGTTALTLIPGIRMEQLYINGSQYTNTLSFSPRFNGQLIVNKNLTLRGGWGITEKLPSYYVLYPQQEYRDILSFGATYNNNEAFYTYYTQPYSMEYNPDLKWQRNYNSEIGVDLNICNTKISLTGYYNRTVGPYQYTNSYSPFSYNSYSVPSDYTMPSNPEIKVDAQTGDIYIRDADNPLDGWTAMDLKVSDTTFTKTTYADNGADVHRRGVELVVDTPTIKPINTQFRVDATYSNVKYHDSSLSYYYQSGWSHTSLANRSYQYVGIYAMGSTTSTSIYNGYIDNNLDMNITAITHIPKARLIISCRVEMTLIDSSKKISEYNGQEYAFNVDESGSTATGGSIYDGDSYSMIYPVQYMDINGNIYDFTEEQASDPDFSYLLLRSNNSYTFAVDGYDPYISANLSITKEIGDNVSLSFYANNFTFSRKAVTSYATGVSAIFVPNFYYGLTCRIKF
ncbi:MAG: TonB-dependent receptor [Rikenellaceae bacterium]